MVALTRIRNNQVYNSDIYADAKIVAKSISGGLLSDNFTYTGNLTIGNLTVNGNTTTLDTTNLVIADPMFSLNRNASGAPAYDLGMVMGRGSATNVAFIWEENSQQFQLQYTTQTTAATQFGIINNSGFANLQAYGIALNNATVGTASITTLTTSSTISSSGNIVANSGTSSTNTTTGALVVNGGTGISGALNVGSGINLQGNGYITTTVATATLLNDVASTVNAFGNASIINFGNTSGTLTINNPTVVGSQTTQNLYNTTATTINFAGAATAINMGATSGTLTISNPTVVGTQSTQNLYNTTATTVNAFGAATSLNMGASSGTVTINNTTLTLPNATQFNINGSNPNLYSSSNGTLVLFANNITTISMGSDATTINLAKNDGTSIVKVNGTANSYGSGQGALQIAGGFYAAGDSYIRGNLVVGNITSTGYNQLIANAPLLYLNSNGFSTYNYEIGFYSNRIDLEGYEHTGFVRNHLDNAWYLFSNIKTEPGSTVDLANASIIYDKVKTGDIIIANTTTSTNTSTGALTVAGGAGIVGNLNVGGNLSVTGNINAVTANIYTQGGIFYGNTTTGFSALYAGRTGYTPLAQTLVQISGDYDGFAQLNIQNVNGNSSASTDIIATANNGDDTQGYIDLGINSSTYYNATYGLQHPNDGYLYVAGNTTTGGGNLVISTANLNDIVFSLGGFAHDNEFARMRANTNSFVISSSTNSSSTGTGALQVIGGAGIVGNVYSGANIYAATAFSGPNVYVGNIHTQVGTGNLNVYTAVNGNITLNANQTVANLVVHGNSAAGWTNLLTTNGANGSVGIKTAPSAITPNASLVITSTDSIIVPSGTTSQRPSNGTAGMLRFNNQSNNLEFYNPSTNDWTGTGSVFTIASDDQFTGDGSTLAFTLSQSGTTNSTLVSINGVTQLPLTAYSVSGTTLTFTEAPLSTDIIDARVFATTSIATALSAGTSAFEVTDSGGANGNIHGYVNGTEYRWIANANVGGSNYFGNGISTLAGNVSCSASVPTVIDSFSTTAFRGAKYVVSVQDYNNYNFQMAEVIMVIGNANATIQTYGVLTTGGSSFCNFYANVSGTTARLYANSSVTSVAKVQQIYMPK